MTRNLDNLSEYEDYDEDDSVNPADLIAMTRLTKDQMKAAALLKKGEVRYLVDMYYNMQKQRIRASGQIRSGTIKEDDVVVEEPNELITWMFQMYSKLEGDMKTALGKYAESTTPGKWALSIMGIGPVIAAGLLAHIDPTIAETSGDVWRYAGYDASIEWLGAERARKVVHARVGTTAALIQYPDLEWLCTETSRKIDNWARPRLDPKTGELKYLIDPTTHTARTNEIIATLSKRPWNASLKRLGYLIGQSFVKSSNRENSVYGPLYKKRKLYEMEKNAAFDYRDQAEKALRTKNFGLETDARKFYEMGLLPPAHIQRRVERWTVKMFLSHYFQVAYEAQHLREMPKPWILASDPERHTHYVPPFQWPIEGFDRSFARTYS